ncbi:hypothetical protein [Paraflavitalea pollutisoli]|uniref:hypothetical protein n=1 Tax=Paraflavitalea pollutisoli TaxID=3034143 RepID=UPI0023ECEB5C|nr:hypothetical protein [Paraflavitalea sp. H1-2-19X]
MNKYIISAILATSGIACTNNPPAVTASTDTRAESPAKTESTLPDTASVQKWITGVIEGFLNSEISNARRDSMINSLTKDYQEFKQDALNVEYDNGDSTITEEKFKKKWQHKYNTDRAGEGGYFISAQDNGKCKVTTCQWLRNTQDASFYKVVIEDVDNNLSYHRDIKVIHQNGKLLIDDILEYD